jgi:hypothetical protein
MAASAACASEPAHSVPLLSRVPAEITGPGSGGCGARRQPEEHESKCLLGQGAVKAFNSCAKCSLQPALMVSASPARLQCAGRAVYLQQLCSSCSAHRRLPNGSTATLPIGNSPPTLAAHPKCSRPTSRLRGTAAAGACAVRLCRRRSCCCCRCRCRGCCRCRCRGCCRCRCRTCIPGSSLRRLAAAAGLLPHNRQHLAHRHSGPETPHGKRPQGWVLRIHLEAQRLQRRQLNSGPVARQQLLWRRDGLFGARGGAGEEAGDAAGDVRGVDVDLRGWQGRGRRG